MDVQSARWARKLECHVPSRGTACVPHDVVRRARLGFRALNQWRGSTGANPDLMRAQPIACSIDAIVDLDVMHLVRRTHVDLHGWVGLVDYSMT